MMVDEGDGAVTDQHDVLLEAGMARIISTAASLDRDDLTRTIRLFDPSDAKAPYLVQVVDEVTGVIEVNIPERLRGRWRVQVERAAAASITKDASSGSALTLTVETVPRELRIPLRVLNRMLRNALRGLGPRLKVDTRKGSFIDFVGPAAGDFGLKRFPFTLRPFKKWIWTAHVRDLNTKLDDQGALVASISVEPGNARYRNGFIQLDVQLEEDGRELEISWAPDADISGLKLSVMVGIGVEDGVPVPEDVEAHFPVRLDFNNLPDGILDGLAGYSRYLQRFIETKILELADSPDIKTGIKKVVSPTLKKLFPTGVVTEIRVDQQFVRILYREA